MNHLKPICEALKAVDEAYCGVGDFEGTGMKMATVIVQVRKALAHLDAIEQPTTDRVKRLALECIHGVAIEYLRCQQCGDIPTVPGRTLPERETEQPVELSSIHPAVLEDVIRGALEGAGANHCPNPITSAKAIMKVLAAIAPKRESIEAESEGPCREQDGCPTEGAVLKRYWRESQRILHDCFEEIRPMADLQELSAGGYDTRIMRLSRKLRNSLVLTTQIEGDE